MSNKSTWLTFLGALGTSLTAGLCCIGPLVVVSLGLGGAWLSAVNVFTPYRNYLIVLTLVMLGYSFFRLYIKPPACGEGEGCILPRTLVLQRTLFWIITILALSFMTFPWYEDLIF